MDRPRGRPRTFDPDRVLDAAMLLFWSRGYEGTSVNDLTAATGLNKPSLYAAFGDKESLYAKVLERYASLVEVSQRDVLEKEPDIWKALESLLRSSASSLASPALPGGCLIVAGLADCGTPNLPTATAEALSSAFVVTRKLVLDRVARAVREGRWPDSVKPEPFAETLLSLMAGMAVQTKAGAAHAALDAQMTVVATTWFKALAALPVGPVSTSPKRLGRPRKVRIQDHPRESPVATPPHD